MEQRATGMGFSRMKAVNYLRAPIGFGKLADNCENDV